MWDSPGTWPRTIRRCSPPWKVSDWHACLKDARSQCLCGVRDSRQGWEGAEVHGWRTNWRPESGPPLYHPTPGDSARRKMQSCPQVVRVTLTEEKFFPLAPGPRSAVTQLPSRPLHRRPLQLQVLQKLRQQPELVPGQQVPLQWCGVVLVECLHSSAEKLWFLVLKYLADNASREGREPAGWCSRPSLGTRFPHSTVVVVQWHNLPCSLPTESTQWSAPVSPFPLCWVFSDPLRVRYSYDLPKWSFSHVYVHTPFTQLLSLKLADSSEPALQSPMGATLVVWVNVVSLLNICSKNNCVNKSRI